MNSNVIKFVSELFKDKVDKNGEPYYNHLVRVADLVQALTFHQSAYAQLIYSQAAYCHDLLEDISVVKEDLQGILFKETINIIKCVTRNKAETYNEYINRIVHGKLYSAKEHMTKFEHKGALFIKYCDLIDNTEENRLTQLDEKTQTRLRKKYLFALREISAQLLTECTEELSVNKR